MISFLGFSVDSLCSLVFLRTIYHFLLGGTLSCWNSIYSLFPISLKIHTYTESLSFSLTSTLLWLYISFSSRDILLEYKTSELG